MTTDASVLPNLFDPLTIRQVVLPNRIGVSPMCMYSAAPDGSVTPWHLVHLGSRAVGGAGLVFVEATAVTEDGRITDGDVGIWGAQHESGLTAIADFVSSVGSVPGIQISHAGRKGGRTIPWTGYVPIEGWQLPAPSPIAFREGWAAPVEMSHADIDAMVDSFVEASLRAVRCGFEVIELHFAHGYLLHQFLSPLSNFRTDEYGVDLAGRARFAVQIASAVRAAVGESVALFARLSVVDWAPEGLTLQDSITIAEWLRDAGIDVIDCSSGAVVTGEKVPTAPLYQVDFAQTIRADAGVMTAAVGLISEPEDAQSVIRDGRADLVLLGRAMLRDAYWARSAAATLGAVADPIIPTPYRRAVESMSRLSQF